MKFLWIVLATALLLPSCATKRTPFAPDGPPTVGMPSELSEREREFVGEVDSELRRQGLMPVRSGKGDLELEFEIAEGPIRTDTEIMLKEGDFALASGKGRAAGVPMVGRGGVAQKSFNQAFTDFSSSLSSVSSRRGWAHSGSASSNLGDAASYSDPLPVY